MEKRKRYIVALIWICCLSFLSGQTCINVEFAEKGEIELTAEIKIPEVNSGYTLWLPKMDSAIGMIVFFHGRRDTVNTDFLIDYSMKNRLAVIYITTENQVEFFFDKTKMQDIEKTLYSVCTKYNIPKNGLLFSGMSLAGTRATKQALFHSDSLSQHRLRPRALAICDSPLDMIRFHKEAVKSGRLAFHPLSANEGIWSSKYLEKNLGGEPKDAIYSYLDYSPYSYIGGAKNLAPLRSTHIRAYTEPDVKWWIESRRKDYYGMNALDLAAMVNELRIMGNKNAEIITTNQKGVHPDGKRHPHSWSIVDEKDLVDWFLKVLSN